MRNRGGVKILLIYPRGLLRDLFLKKLGFKFLSTL